MSSLTWAELNSWEDFSSERTRRRKEILMKQLFLIVFDHFPRHTRHLRNSGSSKVKLRGSRSCTTVEHTLVEQNSWGHGFYSHHCRPFFFSLYCSVVCPSWGPLRRCNRTDFHVVELPSVETQGFVVRSNATWAIPTTLKYNNYVFIEWQPTPPEF